MTNAIIFDHDGTLIDVNNATFEKFPGMEEVLKALSKDFKLVVWSMRPDASLKRILKECGLLTYFSVIVGSDDCAIQKPNGGAFIKYLAIYDLHPVLMVGDSDVDQVAALQLGVPFLQATWPEVPISNTLFLKKISTYK